MSNDDKNKVNTTGHKWDGDLEEYNNPLPRWWVWIFYATIVWGIGYTIAYPAWPLINKATPGLLGFSTRANVAADIEKFEVMNSEINAQLASADLTTVEPGSDLFNYAKNYGEATYATYCSQCHGSGAAGGNGYPNLNDDDWLWGGDIETIAYTIRHGIRNTEDEDNAQYSEMPAFGDDWLSDEEIANVVAYTMSLSGLEGAGDVEAGAVLFEENCSACHMEDGTGDPAQGAPNLSDAIWLYAADPAAPTAEEIEHSVRTGPFGVMPAWGINPSFVAGADEDAVSAKINAVSLYVHQLGGGE